VSARDVQGLKGTDLHHDHGNYLGSGKTTPRFEATLCHFWDLSVCSGRSAVTFKVDAATSMQAPIPTPVLVWAQPVNPFTRHGVLCRLYDLTILAWMPSSRPTEYGHMSGSRGGDCGISGNPSKIGSQAQKNGDPGGGGPWGLRTLKVADLGAGGPWGWRTQTKNKNLSNGQKFRGMSCQVTN